jgi:hypothetical protein
MLTRNIPTCGFEDLIPRDGKFVCRYCGYVLPKQSLELLSKEELEKIQAR